MCQTSVDSGQTPWLMSAVPYVGCRPAKLQTVALGRVFVMRTTVKFAALVASVAALASGFGAVDANALPRCRAPVEGIATATGILGTGSEKARIEARENWKITVRSSFTVPATPISGTPRTSNGTAQRARSCSRNASWSPNPAGIEPQRDRGLAKGEARSLTFIFHALLRPWGVAFAARPRMGYQSRFKAPVAQLDRALPSEGRGRRFESCRVRHSDPPGPSIPRFNDLVRRKWTSMSAPNPESSRTSGRTSCLGPS